LNLRRCDAVHLREEALNQWLEARQAEESEELRDDFADLHSLNVLFGSQVEVASRSHDNFNYFGYDRSVPVLGKQSALLLLFWRLQVANLPLCFTSPG